MISINIITYEENLLRRYQEEDSVKFIYPDNVPVVDKKLSAIQSATLRDKVDYQWWICFRCHYTSLENIRKLFVNAAGCQFHGIVSVTTSIENNDHIHMLVSADVPLNKDWIEDFFHKNRIKPDIKQYNEKLQGVRYTLKTLDSETSEIDYIQYEVYMKEPTTARERRRIKRHQQRMENQTR
jgi:hypothetical protein